MIKITLSGIGGVGGYFGGFLAKHFEHSPEAGISFLARGENEKAIRERGLYLETVRGNFTARPKHISADPRLIGETDYLICSTKAYDLEESMRQLAPCIGKNTVILPLQNGVDSAERIRKIYPANETWEGCVYLVSRLVAPGHVKETGNIDRIFFGSENGNAAKLAMLEKIFHEAGISATLSPDIRLTVWEKFIFISVVATLTSFTGKVIGEVREQHQEQMLALLGELSAVALANRIRFPANIIPLTLEKIGRMQYESTSSMHSDFRKGGKTELESLTGYVVRLGGQLHVPTPVFLQMYESLKRK